MVIPVVVSVVSGLNQGWIPLGDQGFIASRAYDVLSLHTPLVGNWSSTSIPGKPAAYHLGPLLYWLLAVQARFLSPAAMVVTIGAINAASLIGTVVLARRRGGLVLMFATAIALGLMVRSLGLSLLHDIWNPTVPIMPFTFLIYLCWSIACGEYRLLPVTVLVASFIVQSHLVMLIPSVGMVGLALLGLAVVRGRIQWPASLAGAAAEPAGEDARSVRRWLMGAGAVAAVCWIAPAIDQLVHRPGNLVALARTVVTGARPVGPTGGWHVLANAVGIPPAWLTRQFTAAHPPSPVDVSVSAWNQISAALILAGLVAAAWVAIRRGRRDVAAAALMALWVSIAVGLAASGTPQRLAGTLSYTIRWANPAGMWAWLTLAWSVATLARPGPVFAALGQRRRWALGTAATAAVAAAAVFAATTVRDDLHGPEFRPLSRVISLVRARVPDPGAVRVDPAVPIRLTSLSYETALIYGLRRRGQRVVTRSAVKFGKQYEPRSTRYRWILYIETGAAGDPVPPGVVARVPVRTSDGLMEITVFRRRARGS